MGYNDNTSGQKPSGRTEHLSFGHSGFLHRKENHGEEVSSAPVGLAQSLFCAATFCPPCRQHASDNGPDAGQSPARERGGAGQKG